MASEKYDFYIIIIIIITIWLCMKGGKHVWDCFYFVTVHSVKQYYFQGIQHLGCDKQNKQKNKKHAGPAQ